MFQIVLFVLFLIKSLHNTNGLRFTSVSSQTQTDQPAVVFHKGELSSVSIYFTVWYFPMIMYKSLIYDDRFSQPSDTVWELK